MIEIIGPALNQWDTGRVVHITGIEAEYAHFANKGDSKAVILGIVDTHAKIPDFLLQTGKQLCVYAVKDGITVGTRTFYVQKRERPENYVYEDDQRNYIYELIQNAQTAADNATAVAQELREAKDSGEFKGDPGEPATDDQVAAAVEAYMEEHPVEVPDVDMTGVVKSVNGISPDENGNVEIEAGGLSTTAANLLIEILRSVHLYQGDQSGKITALAAELGVTEEEPDTPVEPDDPITPEVTLSSISATYSGGDVAVGTAVSDLTGIVVTATYSDGSTATVTGYTLSGTIAEGSNTITVRYGGKTTTFTVTGVAESGGDTEDVAVALSASWQHSNATTAGYYTDGGETAYTPEWSNALCILSQDVFEKDTLLRITVAPTSQTYCSYLFTSSLIEEGRTLRENDTDDLFYWCVADSKDWSKNHYTVDYTVHAGYKLCILANPSSNVDIITVEKVVA